MVKLKWGMEYKGEVHSLVLDPSVLSRARLLSTAQLSLRCPSPYTGNGGNDETLRFHERVVHGR